MRAILAAYSDPADNHLPAITVAFKLINAEKVSANVATITRYAKRMNLTAGRKPPHKSRKRGSIVATKPNEAWHLDVTVVTTMNNHKAYVQILIDNYSRKILAWKVTTSNTAINSTELLKSAFAKLADVPQEDIKLIVDGGSENNNRHVEAWLETVPVQKLIAQVDVTFSNSMIEAVNKIIKHRYLFRKPILDPEHLQKVMAEAVTDYNALPHYKHCGLSPNEAYDGKIFDKKAYQERLKKAHEYRLRENRTEWHPCIPWNETEDKVCRQSPTGEPA